MIRFILIAAAGVAGAWLMIVLGIVLMTSAFEVTRWALGVGL